VTASEADSSNQASQHEADASTQQTSRSPDMAMVFERHGFSPRRQEGPRSGPFHASILLKSVCSRAVQESREGWVELGLDRPLSVQRIAAKEEPGERDQEPHACAQSKVNANDSLPKLARFLKNRRICVEMRSARTCR
jgi:hypothetical protein